MAVCGAALLSAEVMSCYGTYVSDSTGTQSRIEDIDVP